MMRKGSRIISFALAAAMVLNMPGGMVYAQKADESGKNGAETSMEASVQTPDTMDVQLESVVASGECGENATWQLDSEGTLTISGSGEMEFGTGRAWKDQYQSDIKKVIIEDGITSICYNGFVGCDELVEVQMPNSIVDIGSDAFWDCKKLKKINLSSNISKKSSCLFSGCSSLESIIIPDKVTLIEDFAFAECESLKKADIPEGVESIYEDAFRNCHALESIVIPNSLTHIDGNVFGCCDAIDNITVGEDNTMFTSVDGVVYTKDMIKIVAYPSGKKGAYTISNIVNTIGSKTFYGAKGLTDISIFDSITEIQDGAFMKCTSLESIELPASIKSLFPSCFYGCSSLKELKVPDGCIYLGDYCFGKCSSLEKLYLPASIEGDSQYAFSQEDIYSKLFIYGYKDSIAEKAALDNGIKFVDIDAITTITNCTAAPAKTSYAYTGSAIKPSVVVKDGTKVLTEGTHYSISYSNNKSIGTATVTINGLGQYTDSITTTFKIVPATVKGTKVSATSASAIKLTWTKQSGVTGYQVYEAQSKKVVATIRSNTNTVTIRSLKPGSSHYYKVRAYKTVNGTNYLGAYGSYIKTVVKPSTTSITSLSTTSKAVTVKWSKKTSATGYKIYYSTSSNFAASKTKSIYVSGNTNVSKKITGLTKGKKYYVKVYTYKTYKDASGATKRMYGSSSSVKSITCK